MILTFLIYVCFVLTFYYFQTYFVVAAVHKCPDKLLLWPKITSAEHNTGIYFFCQR